MKKKELTVIIPVYNAEKYLEQVCKKLDNQTFKDFDVIMIDDCSKDNSLKKLKQLEKKYDFIKVYHNEVNKGAGYSRNFALNLVDTEYTMFLDSDDEFPDDYIDALYKAIKKENADMSICDILVKYDDAFGLKPEEYNKMVKKDEKLTKKILIGNVLAASSVNKMFKTKLIKDNPYAEGIMNEDIPAIIGAYIDAKKIAYTEKVYYTYIQHKGSVQNSKLSEKQLDVFKAIAILNERKKGNKILEENEDALIFNQFVLLFYFGICQCSSFTTRRKFIKIFRDKCKDYDLRGNWYYWNFIDSQYPINKVYYKSLMNLMWFKMYTLTSLLVSMYKTYKKIHKTPMNSVIKPNLNLKKVVQEAKKNQSRTDKYGTVSVVIPNYNYAKFLYRRLYSVLSQEVKISELIILDDKSTDNSVDVINEIQDALKDIMKVKVIINKDNSGCVYRQWQRGFQNATSKYVWIAEADDYCEPTFLKTVIEPMSKDDEIYISYTDSSFMLVNGQPTLRSMNVLIDIMKTKHWEKDYINDGVNEIENYEFLNCTIANASSVLFKNGNYDKEFEDSTKYKQVGDWMFYVNIMKKGKIAYKHESLNYCCVHEGSSTSTTKKLVHYNEIKDIHKRIQKEFNIDKKKNKYLEKRYRDLEKEWHIEK